ncbi:MAG: phosphoribosylamine--glycine ligase [Sphingorhabdus sp.]
MNILLIGSGGREHALAWKLAGSPSCDKLYAALGNPGIAEEAEIVSLNPYDHAAVIAFCKANAVDLVVCGPEAPLVAGLGNALRAADIPVFGPDAAPAQLEGSKGFTKDLCTEANIPTAGYVRCDSKADAIAALTQFQPPYVIKADGLAAGKGVIIAETHDDALAALEDMFGGGFGDAGASVVIEEFMTGEEASFFALTDGSAVMAFGSAQDHKRVGDGDTGPNTGGMGAYSPAPVLTAALEAEVMERIIHPTVKALANRGTPYAGVLFAGLMLTEQGPKLIEYNARFGDPECQVLMLRYQGDLAALMLATATGQLASAKPPVFADETALTVVMAANGYPGTPDKGGVITIGDVGDTKVFHAGTAMNGDQLVANGGRVLNVTALGTSAREAQSNAYAAISAIDFPSGFCRRDIGWREVERESRSK